MNSKKAIIIAGSRVFSDYILLQKKMKKLLRLEKLSIRDIQVVSGTARGADRLGERWAKENSVELKQFPANWDKFGKGAGYIRNRQMAEYADILLAFYRGDSRGTLNMIKEAGKLNLRIYKVKLPD